MQFKLPKRLPPLAVAIVTLLGIAGLSFAFTLVDDNGDGQPDRAVVAAKTIPANVQAGDGHPTTLVTVPATPPADLETDLRQVPEQVPDSKVEQIDRAAQENRATTEALPTGGAVVGFKGCVTRILPVNWSPSRDGVRPVWIQDHYTVSRNVTGWADVWGVWGGFANAGRQASSNFIIDAEGHCAYAVPIEGKAWTSAGANPFAVSFEIVAYGNERDYLEPAGWAKLRSVQRQVSRRTSIPLRRGSVSASNSCVPGESGIVEHKDHGLCGGGHVDITPFSIDRAVKMVSAPVSRLTKYERRIARDRCDGRRLVIAAAKGSAVRHARLSNSRAARQVVRNELRRLARAHASGRAWRYHHIGSRRRELARVWTGKGC